MVVTSGETPLSEFTEGVPGEVFEDVFEDVPEEVVLEEPPESPPEAVALALATSLQAVHFTNLNSRANCNYV
jgi:hypothetical protein